MDKVFVIGRDSFPELVRLSSGEEFRAVFVVLPGTSGKYALEIDIDGQDCVVDIAGLYICSGKDSVELDVNLRHNSPGSTSTQQFLGVVGGEAKAVFDGLVYVAPGAMRTKAYQENRSIMKTQLFAKESACAAIVETGHALIEKKLGCGSWGNNSISENLTYYHLFNKSRIAFTKPGATQPTDEEIWG